MSKAIPTVEVIWPEKFGDQAVHVNVADFDPAVMVHADDPQLAEIELSDENEAKDEDRKLFMEDEDPLAKQLVEDGVLIREDEPEDDRNVPEPEDEE